MVNRHISNDLKWTALCLKAWGQDLDDEICHITAFINTLLHTLSSLSCWECYQSSCNWTGQPHIELIQLDCQYILCLARHKQPCFWMSMHVISPASCLTGNPPSVIQASRPQCQACSETCFWMRLTSSCCTHPSYQSISCQLPHSIGWDSEGWQNVCTALGLDTSGI
jgi:hypothetical protein